MKEDRNHGTDFQTIYNQWARMSEFQRNITFVLFWLEMQKRTKSFWLAIGVALIILIAWGIVQDPMVLVVGFSVGLILGVLFFALR